ncbi:Hypothetical protein R9X50_00757800 [Acrodontium crateriforme]|uniref:Ribosome biogenesis protein NOP53 n=1 Tax=Acrodontium crateriforme TaxID=150365 RepID=A0AAQ3MBK6_9PEZI|nr:Hypothetical protein R9X50_00757800 [Acrodontium crateriforme]
MSDTMEGAQPATYKQPSRKGKKAWRKNVDITQLTSGLENLRDEVIQGGVLAEKTADELFVTDLDGDGEVERKQKSQKLLKADEILARRSAVAGLEGRKRKADEVSKIPAGSSKKLKNGKYVSHKDLQRLKGVADNANGSISLEESSASYDPWAPTVVKKDPRLNFLEEKKPARAPKTLKEAPKSLALNGSAIPAVPKPAAGKSYNPLVDDWSALLEREGADAVAAEQKRLAAEAEAEAREAAALAEAAKVEAMEKDEYATDYDSAWESEWDGIDSGEEGKREVFTAKMPKRKTPSERNKIKARKEREARATWEAKEKLKGEQEKRIKSIAREASAKDKARRPTGALARQDLSSDDDAEEDNVKLQRRRFGQLPIPDAPLEVVLPDELEDSLRRLKPEGNLLADRYRNLIVNGKVEVRKRQWQKKQGKKERTEKWSYKDWKLR